MLKHLEALVAFNTQNPPRNLNEDGIFSYIRQALPAGFRHESVDLGDGCISLLSVRGNPDVVFNVHMDTVPADPGWAQDPLKLVVNDTRATGLGAADIKGAAACLLSAAAATTGACALLFTSDEEAGQSRCIKHFLTANKGRFKSAVIAEPTLCTAVTAHRGIATCTGEFTGTAGHASSSRALQDSAVHAMLRWGQQALQWAETHESTRYGGLTGHRFNLGSVEGGTKPNMIASSARVRFGVRPLPDQDPAAVMASIQALAPEPSRVSWQPGFIAPPLSNTGGAALALKLGMAAGDAVDFWTEAALFSAAGIPALVFGPGSITQAHTAGEFVELTQLHNALRIYTQLLG